ncbi:hypothetical protein JOC70_002199 [Clostridium pascui]|uniref:hypothetical protein n=1 Tax=Clostridium pascui TaxID=46609 RepID=UPI00195EFE4A|nr:hypothetical protein [Clostridium pascui]MBM7870705.1 hypothetical protein [Clostridium pascui]
MKNIVKDIGIGSISIFLFILSIGFSISFKGAPAVGDLVLQSIGLKAWSHENGGLHYTILYSLGMLYLSWLIGNSFPNHLWASIGRKLSIALSLCITALILVSTSI